MLLGVVAQLSPWKGQDTAIEALRILREQGIDAHLLLIGSAKFVARATRFDNEGYVAGLRRLVADAGLQDHVTWLGEREDVPELVRALDVLLLPSWEEPFGRALIEAMALKCPSWPPTSAAHRRSSRMDARASRRAAGARRLGTGDPSPGRGARACEPEMGRAGPAPRAGGVLGGASCVLDARCLRAGDQSARRRGAIGMSESSLSAQMMFVAARNLQIDRMIAEVFDALAGASIEAILLKGPAIAGWLYAEGEIRAYGDGDFLVARAQWDAAGAVLRELGFQEDIALVEHPNLFSPSRPIRGGAKRRARACRASICMPRSRGSARTSRGCGRSSLPAQRRSRSPD